MFVGYLRSGKNPGKTAKLLAMLCQSSGFNLLYFTPNDVSSKGTIEGKIYLHNEWIRVKVPIPSFIDVTAYNYTKKNREIFELLNKNSTLSDNRLNLGNLASNNPFIISKEAMNEKLEEYDSLKENLIPTKKITSIQDIDESLKRYGRIVLKPTNGLQGKGVYLVQQTPEGKYQVEYLTQNIVKTKEEFLSLYEKEFSGNRYILQKYVHSRTLQGDPFDCRIHLEKNRYGNWSIVKKVIRIGIGQKVISNVNQGGGVADCLPFLQANFKNQAREIDTRLNVLGRLVAKVVEEVRGTKLMTLGLDIGISTEGDLYLFEVNGVPSISFAPLNIALMRVDYYKYMLNHNKNLKIEG